MLYLKREKERRKEARVKKRKSKHANKASTIIFLILIIATEVQKASINVPISHYFKIGNY